MAFPQVDVEVFADLALRQLSEALNKGQITLPNGKVLTLDTEHVVRIAQWAVTTLKAKKPKFLEVPEDLNLSPTKRSSSK